ncbi:MAG: sigma-70 family RNA polymerase sigma factor [Tannerella sp.]|nr:sigma-70 family RNA polymerase sigma factor [Tannerella sp.]
MKSDILGKSKIKWDHFLSGDNDAYQWLYKTYIHILYSYGKRFTSDTEIIKDCIQEVFTTIYRSRDRLTTPDNVKSYLMISLKNKLIRTLQKKELYVDYGLDEDSQFILAPTVEEEYIENEEYIQQKKKVEKIISILTPRQKEIIYYRYIQELDLDDICKLMDLNNQSAKNLIQRSLNKIRENYDGSFESFLLFLFLSNFISK